MSQSRNRLTRSLTDPPLGPSALARPTRADFYREEFVKYQQRLEQQREFYSERAISDMQAALARIMAQLEHLCARANADEVVARLLREFDVATGLSAWRDPKNIH